MTPRQIYLAIDYGEKRIGVAISTPHGAVVPLTTIESGADEAERSLISILKERKVSVLVAGLPLNERGERTPQCARIERFCKRVAKRVKLELAFVDEHLTSFEAGERLVAQGLNPEECAKNGRIDQIAATIILQDYLNSKSIGP